MAGKQKTFVKTESSPGVAATLAGALLFSVTPLAWAVQQAFPDAATAESPAPPADTTARGAAMPGAVHSGDTNPGVPAVLPSASPAQEREAAPLSTADSQKEETGGNGVRWTVPPIRWGGSSGYALQRNSSSGGQSSMSQSMFSTLNASSYIYAPWAVTLAGRLGLTTTTSSSGSGSNQIGGQDNRSRNASVVGGGEVNIFPVSRFPFQAYFDRSDSRASGNLVVNDYVNTRFGMRQTYRGEDGYTNAGLQFDHSTVESNLGGRDTLTALSGNVGTEMGIFRHSLSGRYSIGQRTQTGEQARLMGFNTTHNATLDDNMNVSANVSFLDNSITGGSGLGNFGDTRTRFLQANAFGTWMPEFEEREDLPLTLSGSVRVGTLHNEFSGNSVDSRNFGGNLNALYRFSNNFTVGANGAVSQVSTSGTGSILLTLMGVNANYNGDSLNIGKFSYNWNFGGNASWQSGSGEIPANLTTGAQAGHTLGRFISLSDSETLSLTVGQNVTVTQNQSLGNSTSLSHSLGASYGMRWGEQFSGNASLSLSDILTTGVAAQHYRMLTAALYGTGQLSPVSSANVNLQFNWNQQTTQSQQTFGFPDNSNGNVNTQHMTLIGSASYTHIRFLGVRGLRYNLLFTADTRMRDDRLFGNVNGEIDRTRWTLNNRLDYRIGRIEFRANAALNDVGGKKNALLFFQVTRQFGAY